MRLLQINRIINSGSAGHITEEIGLKIIETEGDISLPLVVKQYVPANRIKSVLVTSKASFFTE